MAAAALAKVTAPYGAIAQLVERFHGMEEVRGSIPLSSTEEGLVTATRPSFVFPGRLPAEAGPRENHATLSADGKRTHPSALLSALRTTRRHSGRSIAVLSKLWGRDSDGGSAVAAREFN